MSTAVSIKNVSKIYRLGVIGSGTLHRDLSSWWARVRGKPDPFLKIGQTDHGNRDGETIWALKDVTFDVKEGEIVGIIGRNGAGKSTLLKILSRVTAPTSGEIKVRGRVASLLEVGTGFHPELTGRENILLNGAILGMTKAETKRKLDEIVAFAEIDQFLETPVKRYSSGMYVRLAFAVAAHLDPEILVVDEVLAVGDTQFQKKCLGKMSDVAKGGRTVLFVSHNLTAIRTLCSRALLLKQGKVVADDNPNEIANNYMEEKKGNTYSCDWPEEKDAPQNGSTILNNIAVCDDNGQKINNIYSDVPFNIEIDYKVKSDGASVGLNLIFYDNENNCIMASINNHEKNFYAKLMKAGYYKSICKIPKNLLNNGKFSLSLIIFGGNYSDSVIINEILHIEIQDGTEVRGDYYGVYACRIRPLFDWITLDNKRKEDSR